MPNIVIRERIWMIYLSFYYKPRLLFFQAFYQMMEFSPKEYGSARALKNNSVEPGSD